MIKAEVKYTPEYVEAIVNVHRKGSKWASEVWTGFLFVMSLTYDIICIAKGEMPSAKMLVLTTVMLISFGIILLSDYMASPKRIWNKNEKLYKNAVLIYEFEESFFRFSETLPEKSTSTEIPYSRLEKVTEYKDFLFLTLNGTQIHTVKLSDITEGSAEELKDILKSTLGKNYTIKNNGKRR